MKAANVEVLTRMQEAAQAKDWDRLRSCFASDFHNHAAPAHGPDGMASTVRATDHDFDTAHVVHDTIAEGDKVAQRVTMSGTHRGSEGPMLAGIPVEGRAFTWDFTRIWRFADGLVAEHWACRADLGLLRQLS